jgi:hypothetical protein
MSSLNRKKHAIFGLLCLIAAGTIASYIYSAKTRSARSPVETAAAPGSYRSSRAMPQGTPLPDMRKTSAPARTEGRSGPAVHETVDAVVADPVRRIFFRHNALDSHYGRLAFARLGSLAKVEFPGSLSCEAVYVAGGRGICLTADRGVFTTYAATLFDARTFEAIGSIPLGGVPSRCRVSTDGSMAALTVFVSGHSYASVDFSTQTLLIDTNKAKVLADVEDYSVSRNGQPFSNKDFNFWGVTFTPDATQFYCTLSTNRQHFLVKGDISSRSVAVVHDQVECPSLSPDGTRIAYKKRLMENGRLIWRTQILHLRTRTEVQLPETRSVDDQLEWLDGNHVLYALSASETGSSASTDIWVAAADGSREPELFLKNAYSPSVERSSPR